MSMLDAFFNKGFKGAKCKTLLKLTIPRIKLLRNRREIQLKQMRKDIAKLLENGQEATARIRVEHIIREENMMAAQEIIELFSELIAVRLPIIETQRECPLDLKEAISSICFAAPRCSDLPELQQVQMLFAMKYGKEFVLAATELMPDCGVNRQIIELLSVRAPSIESKLKLLKEIAEEHELDWDPAASETEFLKPHDDLLNGPNHNHIIGGPMPPLPKEKHDESLSSKPVESHEESDSDEDFESLDLPEVPTASVRATSDIPSASHIIPPPHILPPPPPPHYFEHDTDHTKLTTTDEPEVYAADPSLATPENKQFQFIPFVSSPPSPPAPKPSNPTPTLTRTRTRTETNVDLQDVLAAAHTAAETAERAAAAARAAASLAQVRISELVTYRNGGITGDGEKNVPHDEAPHPQDVRGSPIFDKQNSFDGLNRMSSYDSAAGLGSPTLSAHGVPRMEAGSPVSKEQAHQPQRSTSLEDDPYFSYPNLFTASQDTSTKPSTPPS